MGEEASNAFLKTLEEHGADGHILLTAQPQRLLPTIYRVACVSRFGPAGSATRHTGRAS